jgi:protein-tyrosine phosphatase
VIRDILVVCEGNICRSPMARALLASRLPGARVLSAGTGALAGRPADPVAIALMAEMGHDIRDHTALGIHLQLVRGAGLVLTMTAAQTRHITARYPFARGRVYRLLEREGTDVIDPYRQDRETFRAALGQIVRGVGLWGDKLSRSAAA